MPYIDVNVNCRITEEKELALKAALGEIITEIPGKTEGSLMIQFKDNCRLWHSGENGSPIAVVNVMLYGSASKEAYKSFADSTIALFGKELGIDGQHVYVKFEEVSNWFWG